MKQVVKIVPVLLLLAAVVLAAASCGSEKSQSSETASGTSKLPPGTTAESLNQTSTTGTNMSSGTTSKTTTTPASSHQEGVTLENVNFTVTGVTRDDSNATVVSGSVRELSGDFLQIDLTIANASGELVDLSNFSYRLYGTAIDASSYDDYYGTTTTYGGYVKKSTISASLLSTSSLQQVSYVLRDGESVGEVFLFFDLNPLTTDANPAFTLAGADLIIYDTATATEAGINLGAFTGR